MADVSDSKINEAYEEVRSNKSDVNWVLIDYENDRSDKLVVTATGTGGLASYAYVRVTYSNDKESQREKFILVTWIGSGCKVLRRAKISVHAADVKSVFRAYSIDVAAREKDDLKEDPIIVRLRKAGGASYDGV
ncbi:ADF-like domain-containing protein [Lactarius quietus]|nr:ADF-like domain-containing protein [Lactarius quietus]